MLNYLRNPSTIFRFGSPQVRREYFNLRNFLSPGILGKRREHLDSLPDQAVKVDSQKGFYRTDAFKDSNALRQAISYGNECVSAHLENQDRKNHKKNYLQNIEFESSLENPLVRLALNKDLVSIASEYLGFVPYFRTSTSGIPPMTGVTGKAVKCFTWTGPIYDNANYSYP